MLEKTNDAEDRNQFNRSFWNHKENMVYLHFLREFGNLFESDWHRRKSLKINVLMSEHVKTRSPLQCRSHHQKMMKFHKDIPHIIEHLSKLEDGRKYEEEGKGKEELQDLTERLRCEDEGDLW